MSVRSRIRSTTKSVSITPPSGDAGFTDDFYISLQLDDVNSQLSDDDSYKVELNQSDDISEQTEEVSLGFPKGVWGESSIAPTDEKGFLIRVWLSGSSGANVVNPSNADGSDNGSNAVVSTTPLESNIETLTSNIGTSIVGSLNLTAISYRGWFRARTSLSTSTASVIAHSTDGSFTDIIMFTLNSGGGDLNFLDGSFTFDLFTAGVDTLDKLKSLQVYHRCIDAVAGVTPGILDVDAGSADITVIL
jgi:hypothetical protein